MEPKKISFGFSKLAKKTNIVSKQPISVEKKRDFIDCLEGQSIKIKDAVEEVKGPLVIPLNDSSKNLLDRVKEAKRKSKKEPVEVVDERPDSELTVEELAARQLLRESKNLDTKEDDKPKIFTLPAVEDKFVAEGKEEATIADYENVPITEYGLAMLRGMGWAEDKGIGKQQKVIKTNQPELRPKGMGLGANKLVNTAKPAIAVDKNGKELSLVKGAYAKIIAGQHKANYCEVQGLDDESGRIIVKTALKGLILTLNEFLLAPVTKEEFAISSKVINNAKYEEFKEKSDRKLKQHRESNSEQNGSPSQKEKAISKNVKEEKRMKEDSNLDSHDRKGKKKSKKHKKSRSRSSSLEGESKQKHRKSRRHSSSESEQERSKERSRRNSDSDGDARKSKKSMKQKYRENESESRRKSKKANKDKTQHRRCSSSSSDHEDVRKHRK